MASDFPWVVTPTILKKLKKIMLVTRKMRTWDKTGSPSIRGDDFIG